MRTVRDDVALRVKAAFDEVGIEIPFPQRVIHVTTSDIPLA
jgi:small-conductance mechanosensitive channel